jgi:hypothetical protein
MGMNPGANPLLKAVKAVAGVALKRYYAQYMDSYGLVARGRARRVYDAYVHLPIEFPMDVDGHRPVSEDFRRLADRMLVETVEELEIPCLVVHGSVEERIHQVCEAFNLEIQVPVREAVAEAERRVAAYLELLAEDNRVHEAAQAKSFVARLKYALRY